MHGLNIFLLIVISLFLSGVTPTRAEGDAVFQQRYRELGLGQYDVHDPASCLEVAEGWSQLKLVANTDEQRVKCTIRQNQALRFAWEAGARNLDLEELATTLLHESETVTKHRQTAIANYINLYCYGREALSDRAMEKCRELCEELREEGRMNRRQDLLLNATIYEARCEAVRGEKLLAVMLINAESDLYITRRRQGMEGGDSEYFNLIYSLSFIVDRPDEDPNKTIEACDAAIEFIDRFKKTYINTTGRDWVGQLREEIVNTRQTCRL